MYLCVCVGGCVLVSLLRGASLRGDKCGLARARGRTLWAVFQ